MYATLCIIKDSKRSGRIIGTHQKLDKAARRLLGRNLPVARIFPTTKEILYFEGMQGPDGLKRKSPGVDEPEHFLNPDNDDGVLWGLISDHHWNLVRALKSGDRVRASFEAAWMAHAITDGLTPAHQYPFREKRDEIMGDAEYMKLFGIKIKGLTKGGTLAETIRRNWLYLGTDGVMTKHIAYEYGVAYVASPVSLRKISPKNFCRADAKNADLHDSFYSAVEKVAGLKMYDKFLEDGWTTGLVADTREVLLPEIVRAITLAWASAANEAMKNEKS